MHSCPMHSLQIASILLCAQVSTKVTGQLILRWYVKSEKVNDDKSENNLSSLLTEREREIETVNWKKKKRSPSLLDEKSYSFYTTQVSKKLISQLFQCYKSAAKVIFFFEINISKGLYNLYKTVLHTLPFDYTHNCPKPNLNSKTLTLS